MSQDKTLDRYAELTQAYTTWGDKLLQHTDVLHALQHEGKLRPITIQLALTEVCDSDCPFCSVANRPPRVVMPFSDVNRVLEDFRVLGAKSVELTGGGNPMLYRDRETRKDINDVILRAKELGYDIGLITNSHSLERLTPDAASALQWARVSLIQLDEGVEPESYNFGNVPISRIGFSYIIYDPCEASPIRGRAYAGTTAETIHKIARLVGLHPEIKFVRLAGNCLVKGVHPEVRAKYTSVITAVDEHHKFFLKTVEDDEVPFDAGCYVGAFRPYIAPPPLGIGRYQVYICSSHVLNKRTYDLAYSLCDVGSIPATWAGMEARLAAEKPLYEVNGNGGCGWLATCEHCFYQHNNRLLHTVATPLPDRNFA